MTDFGDMTDADSFDPSEPDPQATARIFVHIQRNISQDPERKEFDDLHPFEKALLIFSFALLLERLRREGAGRLT